MGSIDEAEATIPQARHLRYNVEDVWLAVLRSTLRVVSTMHILAEQETGEEQERHLRTAEDGLRTVAEMLKGIRLSQEDRDALEQVSRDVLSLCGKIGSAACPAPSTKAVENRARVR